jgi:hypothetical protein
VSYEDMAALALMENPGKPWCNFELPVDKVDEALLATAT